MSDFETKLASFVEGVNELYNEYMDARFPNNPRETIEIGGGRKYIKLVKVSEGRVRSVYCFVDSTNGDVLKAASFKAPAKHARGNIFNDDNGLGGVGPYGANYL